MEPISRLLMRNPVFAGVYERIWRPTFTRLFSLGGSATEDYDRALRAWLARPGERLVLDVACGPGNYTRLIADGLTGDGRCAGIDFSPAMLRQAVRTNATGRATYLRADAHAIPFADNTFDVVTCLAALYLIPDPLSVIDEMVRVARPGGEIVIFTSVATELTSLPGVRFAVEAATGFRIFDEHAVVDRLRAAGAVDVEQTITGQGQYVLGVAPDFRPTP
ncbi:methyltransferase type 11 [Gordonia paraffinivorans]|uniref:class I SAM-dependent methyltransferase n=1 Tax=Gordonia paraffinivorans TaxID=175628 RepID=UPI000D613B0D|nr:methyltransferase domain-containing protein [Gordonia paraffinivorans]PWD41513.1 methyltransferase type 11 [Gordonia paraffinivorans]